MFGDDVHSDFCQIHIGADTGSGGDAGFGKNLAHNGSRHRMWPHAQRAQIWRGVDKHLINRIHMDVFGSGVPEIDTVDLPADFQIMCHARLGDDHRGLESWRVFQIACVTGLPDQSASRSMDRALDVDPAQALFYLEQPCTTRNAIGLERR